jgi:hypothetical protein
MCLQPITYSLAINIIVMLISGGLAFAFAAPWVFIVAILVSNHALSRFSLEDTDEDEAEIDEDESEPDDYNDSRAGFTAKVGAQ